SGQLAEHEAVRKGIGLFDLSHMGEFRLRGPGALAAAEKIVTNRVLGTDPGQVVYSPMCYPHGGIVDDLLIYHLEDSVLLVVNASNIEKDLAWVKENLPQDVSLENESYETSLLAVQGPRVEEMLQQMTEVPLSDLGYYRTCPAKVGGLDLLLSRTGYTGEDGFELYVKDAEAPDLWNRLMEVGKSYDITPIGLAARDTLRFEMGYCLYGNDIDETTNPLEANLGWTVKIKKEDFVGRDALVKQKEDGVSRKLVGLEVTEGRMIPRQGYTIEAGGSPVGKVTSGTFAPSLGKGYALGYVDSAFSKVDTELNIQIRNKAVPAAVRRAPFYKDGTRKSK
ncbi:MAG: glycine cleavage system aminomethyltransferase GcvT, partial [Candidatus Eisenbacteria bacterium]|nr:glycine cleavage system aminomethyltransferase GcvT [Candidatus Eisenbacteria bacterium]